MPASLLPKARATGRSPASKILFSIMTASAQIDRHAAAGCRTRGEPQRAPGLTLFQAGLPAFSQEEVEYFGKHVIPVVRELEQAEISVAIAAE